MWVLILFFDHISTSKFEDWFILDTDLTNAEDRWVSAWAIYMKIDIQIVVIGVYISR